jgi:hypothetical protein
MVLVVLGTPKEFKVAEFGQEMKLSDTTELLLTGVNTH